MINQEEKTSAIDLKDHTGNKAAAQLALRYGTEITTLVSVCRSHIHMTI
jgi:hypothetical protein